MNFKIGDRIFVRGYIDEIRKDTVIVRNDGGYFGTIPSEVTPSAQPEIIRCKDCEHWKNEHLCERLSRFGSFETKADFYCGYPERRTDD